MDKTYTDIDFETALGRRWSICQVGLVGVESGIVSKKEPVQNFGACAEFCVNGRC